MKLKELRDILTRDKEKLIRFSIVLVIAATVFIGMTFYRDAFQAIGNVLLVIEFVTLVAVAWAFAGHAVMKSLFRVGASLSLMIFLAQSYCDTPHLTQASNEAMQSLLGFSFLYLSCDFFRSLYKEVTAHTKRLREMNDGKNPWFFVISLALFVGIFTWQLYQVMFPIFSNLCIYYSK